MGLFATVKILPGQRVSKFSGAVIPYEEAQKSSSSYLMYVNKRISLDASGTGHMVGRYINEGTISGLPNNARFGASGVVSPAGSRYR